MKKEIYDLLEKYWGYESFLPLQEQTIGSILKGNDSLTVLPTGGGKSLCFQLPVLLESGMAVVISPLISLMKDQVDALNDIGLKAAFLNSSLNAAQQETVIADIRGNRIKLLYMSPERLQAQSTLDLLKEVQAAFFVIDEAHCISHWGHDFRAEYRDLGKIKKIFNRASVHAFTATATKEVQDDIVKQLKLQDPAMHIGGVDRCNLTYRVRPRLQIKNQVVEVLQRHSKEPGIIYCLRRKDVDKMSNDLKKLGFDNAAYHAGMTDKARHIAQEKFVGEEIDIIVATVAFGMGIDRANIRFVIHAGMPKSIEHYQQETGRAGRDGLPAFCYMFYSAADYQLWNYFAGKSKERGILMSKLSSMYDFCASPQCRHKVLVNYFSQSYEFDSCDACDYCLKELDMVEKPLLIAQQIISAVESIKQEGYGFGAGYVSDVLRGRLADRITNLRHHELAVFGAMESESTAFIRYMIDQLIGQGFLEREEEFSTLFITEKAQKVLRSELTPLLVMPLRRKKKEQIAKQSSIRRLRSWAGVDQDLFERLRQKRAELARKKGVPAYIIFGDKTLKDMAAKKPLSKNDFADIYGVGEQKLKQYADVFIDIIAQT